MKVFSTKPRNHWLSPYTILGTVLFWKSEDWVYGDSKLAMRLVDILHPFCKVLEKIRRTVYPTIDYVKIDRHDTWSFDHTLAPIIAAGLRQLREEKSGVPGSFIYDSEGVEVRSTEEGEALWNEALDAMIWSFTEYSRDWEQDFMTGETDWKFEKDPENKDITHIVHGPLHNFVYDYDAVKVHRAKIQHGIDLFAKHYGSLWS